MSATTDTAGDARAGLIELGGLPPLGVYLKDAWSRREFAVNMASGELRSQNFDTVLGNVWHVLNPSLLVGVYFLMFGIILDVSRGMANFIGFLAVGIFTYGFLQRCAMSGASAVVGNLGLIRSLQFPRVLLPASAVLKEAMAYGTTLVVMFSVTFLTELRACSGASVAAECGGATFPITAQWLLFVPLFLLMLVFGFGMALWTARLTDHVRDTANLLPYAFRILFYVSGVLYPVDRFVRTEWMRELFNLNPFYEITTLARHSLMLTTQAEDVGRLWLYLSIWAVVTSTTGLLFFRARENRYGRG